MGVRTMVLLAAAVAVQPPGATARWRQDVAVARTEFLQKDASYSPERRAQARARLDKLDRDLPGLTDQQIVAELARVAALADNGHTRAYLLRNRGWWRRYPIRIWRFDDGWRIVAVRPGNEALLGARLLSIGGTPIGAAEAAVRPLYGGTELWGRYMATYSLTSPDALLGTGVKVSASGEADLELEHDGRRFAVTVTPAVEPKRAVPEESWWFLSPNHPAVAGWRQVLAGTPLPPYLDHAESWYELRTCRVGTLYLKFTRSEDQPGRPTLAEFSEQVLDRVVQTPRAKLVIDLRFNTGGNLQKTQRLFQRIAESPIGRERGRLFVILGPSTFSAGITPAAILKQDAKPVIVGSEPGDRLRFWAEGGNVILPNSGIALHYADRAHVYSSAGPEVPAELVYLRLDARTLTPDLPAPTAFADYVRGRDPAALRIDPAGFRCERDASGGSNAAGRT